MLTRSKAKALKLAETEQISEEVKTKDPSLDNQTTVTKAKNGKKVTGSRSCRSGTNISKARSSQSKRSAKTSSPKPTSRVPERVIAPASSSELSPSPDEQSILVKIFSGVNKEPAEIGDKGAIKEIDAKVPQEKQPPVQSTVSARPAKAEPRFESPQSTDDIDSKPSLSTTPNKNIESSGDQQTLENDYTKDNANENEVILKRRRESGAETPVQEKRLNKRLRYDDNNDKALTKNKTPEKQVQSLESESLPKGDETPMRHAKRSLVGDIIGSPSPMRNSSAVFATQTSFASPGISASARKSSINQGVMYTPISKYAQSTLRPDTVPAPKHSWSSKTSYETPIKHTIPRPFVFATAARAEEKKKRLSMSPEKASPLKNAAPWHLNALQRSSDINQATQGFESRADTSRRILGVGSAEFEDPNKSCQSPLFDVENIRNDAAPYFEQSVSYLKRIAAEKGTNGARYWESRRPARGNTAQ